ncbi:hypothetical protein Peur_059978 [Populus x canadensis]
MVKEISLRTSLSPGKPSYLSKDRGPLLGQSIFSINGLIWSHQRKLIAPEFYMDKVKCMVSLMVDSTTTMQLHHRRRYILEAENSSRCDVMSRGFIGIRGSRYTPTKNNWEIWKLEKEINSMILKVVKERAAANYEKDLLQMILEGAKSYGDQESFPSDVSLDRFIVDNCKAIYLASHETTAITASWCLMLLAANQEWQPRARAEVLEICKNNLPDADMLRNMKTLAMVIQETMRL